MRALLPLLLILVCAACGSAESYGDPGGTGGTGGSGAVPPRWRPGGPLAHAGADQRVLEGMPVRLDGRGSLPGEEGLPIALLWTQEAGPRVVLDDPTSAEPWFVAPPLRSGQGTRLVFALTVDDGSRRDRDRVVVELVEKDQLLPAPVVVGRADQEVRFGDEVHLGEPLTLDPACLDEGGDESCLRTRLDHAWRQVEGPPVTLRGDFFTAPDFDAILTFRLDAKRGSSGSAADCGPEGSLLARPFCSAPDHVRIRVRRAGRLDTAPAATLREPAGLPTEGGLLRLGQGLDPALYPQFVTVMGTALHPDSIPVEISTFRPLLGDTPTGPFAVNLPFTQLRRSFVTPDGLEIGGWPRTTGVAFVARSGKLSSSPAAALIRWEPTERASALPQTDAGESPCADPPLCSPFVGGDSVTLDGSATVDPDTPQEKLSFCWYQTFGPQVEFAEGAACLVGVPNRTFVAPEAPPGGTATYLSFLLVVSDGGPLVGIPDTAVVQVRPADNQPPQVDVVAPAAVDEGEPVLLDASGSSNPEGSALTFSWRQLETAGVPRVTLEPSADCAAQGACATFVAPAVHTDTTLRFEVTVADAGAVAASRLVTVLVRNSQKDPPVVEAGRNRAVRPGAVVELEGSASDPDPGDDENLSWRWRVIEGDVELESSVSPLVRFVAPEPPSDLDLVLELEVRDEHGLSGTDRITVSVLVAGPYVRNGGDDEKQGSASEPVATLSRALEIAAAEGFEVVHLQAWDRFEAPAQTRVGGIVLRGDWAGTPGGRAEISAAGSLHAGDGTRLESLRIVAGSGAPPLRIEGEAVGRELVVAAVPGGEAVLVLPGASLELFTSEVEGGAIRCGGEGAALGLQETVVSGGTIGVEIAAGCESTISRSRIEAGGGSDTIALLAMGEVAIDRSLLYADSGSVSATGLAGSGPIRLTNGIVHASGPAAIAARLAGPAQIHSSLLRTLGTGDSALVVEADGVELRNTILDSGGALVREAGGLPLIMRRVLFARSCSADGPHLRRFDGSAVCDGDLAAVGSGWEPIVAAPGWIDPHAGDFRLAAGSAAIDAGTSEGAPAHDLAGAPRGGDGNGDGTPGFDIGPFERVP